MAEMTFLPETNLTPEAALEAANEIISALDKEERMNIYASAIKTIEEFKGSDTFLQKFRKEVEANDGEEAWESLRNAEETIQTALENRALIYSLEKFFPDADPLALSYAGAQISVEARKEEVKEETKQSAAEQALKQDNKRPRKSVDPITKLSQSLTDDRVYDPRGVNLDVTSREERRLGKEVLTSVSIEMESFEGIRTSRKLDQYDVDVNGAVATLWAAGNKNITVNQVYRTLTGSTGKPDPKQIEEVRESLEKQFKTLVDIDYTQEARGRELKFDGEKVTSFKVRGHIVEARWVEIETANGKRVDGLELLKTPPLYEYAATLGQIVSYPQRLLSTSGRNSRENIVIKKYLLRRIGQIKGKSKVSPVIRYETVYEKAGIVEPTRKKAKQVNDYIVSLMNEWKEAGHISGFVEVFETAPGSPKRAGIEINI